MGKIETALKEEILRLAKKVARQAQAKTVEEMRRLKARVSALQAEVGALKHEREQAQARERMELAVQAMPEDETASIRMSGVLIKKLRARLKLTQPELAKLLGVSNASVGFWEGGKTNPRPATKAKLAALRKLGKRDTQRLLEEVS